MIRSYILALPLALTLASPAIAEGLTVSVQGVKNARGNILIFVFDNAQAFETLDVWEAVDFTSVRAKKGLVRQRFSKLRKGPYAVFLFHDENRDQRLNATQNQLFEGVGSSGAPKPGDEPDFNAASVDTGETTVIVHYPK
jgi:uncharacterized protein (DUF2141 family)